MLEYVIIINVNEITLNKSFFKKGCCKMKEIKISFYANIDEDDIAEVTRVLNKYGAEIISQEIPELENVGCFAIEEDPLNDNYEE